MRSSSRPAPQTHAAKSDQNSNVGCFPNGRRSSPHALRRPPFVAATMARSHRSWGQLIAGFSGAAMMASAATACRSAVLTQQVEARRLASDLRVQFTKAADAANSAVMADSDATSATAAREAEQATQAVVRDVEQLRPILTTLGSSDELRALATFHARFVEYQKLDAEILPLAVENTNLKAQRLSFGPGREAADAFGTSLEAAVKLAASTNRWHVEALGARARASVFEIQALQAPHIAEAEDAAMTRLEEEMSASKATARTALAQMKSLLGPDAGAHLAAATNALDRFEAINRDIITLSRRNSNVRSLALSLGQKRTVTAQCDDQLRALQEALAKHSATGTR